MCRRIVVFDCLVAYAALTRLCLGLLPGAVEQGMRLNSTASIQMLLSLIMPVGPSIRSRAA